MPRLSKIGAAALAAFGWTGLSTVSASYLVVAGGGGSGYNEGGGGGGGGYQTGTTSLDPTLSYTVIVGAGGNGDTNNGSGNISNATNGSNSQFGTLTASVGGGFGGGNLTGTGKNGANGGSGGGVFSSGTAGTGTSGQGNAGGTASTGDFTGGGGGAGAAGGAGNSSTTGAGGNGLASSISGTSTYYAGGGSGGGYNGGPAVGAAGLGGGGAGGYITQANAGTANTGGGGGGGAGSGSYRAGANGGSGVVIISYASPQKFGGGIVTTSGSNTIHTFQTSGTLSPLSTLSTSALIVAGGGGGGSYAGGGGGGAGGMQTPTGITIDTNSIYVVTVGAGGTGGTNSSPTATSGANSIFSAYATASVGGGSGGGYYGSFVAGATGGSGGGAPYAGASFGSGTSGQGNAGASGTGGSLANNGAGGGGGAGAVGGAPNLVSGSPAGAGGVGLTSSISGTSTYYAGGGGGGDYTGTGGAGGTGGGGAGGSNTTGTAGTANTGGGGGGSGSAAGSGAAGGSGVVIISYAGATQQMAGGTVTISGGNVIHTFTSSGYLTPLKLVNNSLRFRSSASGYLNRTPTNSPTDAKKYTYSAWIKKAKNATSNQFIYGCGSSGSDETYFGFNSSDAFEYLEYTSSAYQINVSTTAVFRDPAAWYHLVLVLDTTQATSTNRVKLYINGVQQTLSGTFPSLNYATSNVNSTDAQNINRLPTSGGLNFDGYYTEINMVDGQALTPNSFGTFNSYGVWQPITYGGSYGTNGFYLPFNANTSSYAGSFNGSNQYLTFTDSSNVLDMGGATTSFEGFVYVSGSLSTGKDIFGKQGGSASWSTSNGWEYILYINSSYKFSFQYNNAGSPATIADTTARNIGQWYWVVVATDASNNISMFVDGVKVATATNAITKPTTRTTMWVLAENGPGSVWLGSASNFRFVSGSNAYSPTATSLTVPTTNLTAVTGTQLLTLQNATIIDNSTNAFSITNNGSVTTAQTYPFSAGYIFNDQGPAGNNWTPNNISGASGSTLDYMTDVPTLTSATVANYCVLNPLEMLPNMNLSQGNLYTVATSGYDTAVKATMPVPLTGKYYWEITDISQGNRGWMGIYHTNRQLTSSLIATTPYDISYGPWDGKIYVQSGTSSGTYSTSTTGDIVMFAIDADNGRMYVGKNGTWFNSGVPASGTGYVATLTSGQQYSPWFGETGGTVTTVAFNFGQRPFSYTPPTGFVALNTYNL